MGFPGLVFMLGAIVSTVALLDRIGKRAKGDASFKKFENAALSLKIALAGFCTTIFFINFAYTFYLPMMSGITSALALSADLFERTNIDGRVIRQQNSGSTPNASKKLKSRKSKAKFVRIGR